MREELGDRKSKWKALKNVVKQQQTENIRLESMIGRLTALVTERQQIQKIRRNYAIPSFPFYHTYSITCM
jgi:hypothetical protein